MLPPAATYPGYRDDPLGFITDILGITPTEPQVRVIEALLRPPHRVLASSGHSVGKSNLGACLVLWWHYCRYPGICLTTAPTDRQVKDILWKEVRTLAARAGLPDHWVGPKIPRLESSPVHFAHGFTARDSTGFQGQHSPGGLLIVYDEAEGVEPPFWAALKTMLDDRSFFVAFYNPTTPGSAAHQAEEQADQHGTFTRVTLSCLDHPNIKAQAEGRPPVVQGAITLGQLEAMLLEDSQVLPPAEEAKPGDVALNGKRYRPGPIAEARCLGRRPTHATTGVWSSSLWDLMLAARHEVRPEWPVALGCDVGRYGDDHTVIFVRKGLAMLHVESHVKQNTSFVAKRLAELCCHFADRHNPQRRIPVLIDEGGVGGGVIDQHDGHNFVPINASRKPMNEERYLNVRAELAFHARQLAAQGLVDVSRLTPAYLPRLRQELLSMTYQVLPGTDRIQVARKDDLKKLLGRSPDAADAFFLALYKPPKVLTP